MIMRLFIQMHHLVQFAVIFKESVVRHLFENSSFRDVSDVRENILIYAANFAIRIFFFIEKEKYTAGRMPDLLRYAFVLTHM